MSSSWYKTIRSGDAWELMTKHPLAYRLASIVAWRARWRDGFNEHGLEQGEAMLGDWEVCGMSEQEYRTAKKFLEKHDFATFKPTTNGTIAKLTDSRLFDYSPFTPNEQNNERLTNGSRTPNERLTTNQTGIDGNRQKKTEYKGKEPAPPLKKITTSERISMEKLLPELKAQLQEAKAIPADERTNETYTRIRELKTQIATYNQKIQESLNV